MMNEEGMTNMQYKGMLIDERECWENVKKLAEDSNCYVVVTYAEKQIEKINKKLSF